MRALRRTRAGRVTAAAGLVVLAVGAAAACEAGALSGVSVGYTTDLTATHELERRHVDVSWLSCTADVNGDGTRTSGRSPTPSRETVASVDCRGKTDKGKDITVKGRVTRAVNGACVRGSLRATVGGRQVFRVKGLGDCGTRATPVPPAVHRPSAPGRPDATVTVTATRTIWCHGDPTCWPVEGK
ncbi:MULTISPECIES: hypothetical protein [Streptomyces]|uniref:Lipoprotein n=1 Tax=Streptomyces griseoaurantiacus TaxID=68213 RepID=A0ABZ1V5M1_9ACTN|nr:MULTISPECIES: hypothetical protein [Streptomyces]MDX3362863.1 hypothetical protein [Streptomyces sp. ME02-6978.2a]NJP69304.1 hypothetical protein [Streptomyces sp. C1-2]WTI26730.1 hypothetical protein OHA67_10440 [Streptomyces jietaisiensis]